MKITTAVHLSVRSSYSLLQSTLTPQRMVKLAKEQGFEALCLSDTGNMHGVMEFVRQCKLEGIKALVGCEFTVAYGDEKIMLQAIAKNQKGYQSLMHLSSLANTTNPILELNDFKDLSANLFLLVYSVDGPFDRVLLRQEYTACENIYLALKEVLGSFYIGITHHEDKLMHTMNYQLMKHLPQAEFVAVPRVYYGEASEVMAHKILKGIQSQQTLKQETLIESPGRYFMSPDEMLDLYGSELTEKTSWIANQCNLEFEIQTSQLPHFPLQAGLTSKQYLTQLSLAGLKKRFPHSHHETVYRNRLKMELDVIISMNYQDYFLIVWDFIRFAKSKDIYVGPGRGSAACSLVAYCLGITHVDPIEHQLLFERFLNPERVSMPDIDTDFPDNRREEVIRYVAEKYGLDHVAHISTFGTLAARQVLRDVGRVLDFSVSELDIISKAVPNVPKMTLRKAYEMKGRLSHLVDQDQRYHELYQTALLLEGLPRHVSTHAAGIVMSRESLETIVPMIRIEDDLLSTQFSMEYLEDLGLIKMDFLGLRNLSIIDEAVQSIRKTAYKDFDILKIPMHDLPTLKLIRSVDTVGLFQLESEGMKKLLRDIQVESFDDITVTIALFRPGPMENIPLYLESRRNPDRIDYLLPELEDILRPTFGVLIYQEQIMQVAQRMAGFSLGKADILRKAMSKKNETSLKRLRQDFIDGCIKQGHSLGLAEKIYDLILKFANYGFVKAHSVAYAMIAYQMAYLKANFGAYFMQALLNGVIGSESKTEEYCLEAKKLNIKIAGPSVNHSHLRFTLEDETIRLPLLSIKGLGSVACQAILDARGDEPFRDYPDFIFRTKYRKLNRSNIEALIDAGALDCFDLNRTTLRANLESLLEYADLASVKDQPQLKLDDQLIKPKPMVMMEDDSLEVSEREKAVLGFYLASHPIMLIKEKLGIHTSFKDARFDRSNQSFVAVLKKLKRHQDKRGRMMAFLKIADETAEWDAVLFTDLYSQVEHELKLNQLYQFEVLVDKEASCIIKQIKRISYE